MRSLAISAIALLAVWGHSAVADDPVPETVDDLPLVFQADFDGDLDGWVMTDPAAWKIVDDNGDNALALHQQSKYSPPVRSPVNIARIDGLELTDFVLEARMRQTGREYGHRDMCIFFGYQDPSHFYYVHMATAADPHAHSVFLVNDEPRVSICDDRTDGVDWGTDYHTVRLVRDALEGTIEVYFDDMTTPIMRAEDTTFTCGTVGFGSFDDTGNIDKIRIWGAKKP